MEGAEDENPGGDAAEPRGLGRRQKAGGSGRSVVCQLYRDPDQGRRRGQLAAKETASKGAAEVIDFMNAHDAILARYPGARLAWTPEECAVLTRWAAALNAKDGDAELASAMDALHAAMVLAVKADTGKPDTVTSECRRVLLEMAAEYRSQRARAAAEIRTAKIRAEVAAQWDGLTAELAEAGKLHVLVYKGHSIRTWCHPKDGPVLWAEDVAPVLGVSRWDIGHGAIIAIETLMVSDDQPSRQRAA
ncbi:MAG: hypothetical protein ACJ8AI_27545 [Rhodopila sp.]